MSIHGWVITGFVRASGWSGMRAWPRLEKLCKGRVLNVGCGAHLFGERCDSNPVHSPDYLVDFSKTDIDTYRAPFDTVLMSDVIEHLVDDRGALALAYRLLSAGGRIVVRTPSMHSWSQLSFSLRGKPMVERPGTKHVRDGYTTCALKLRLRDAGFKEVRRVSPFLSEELVMVAMK